MDRDDPTWQPRRVLVGYDGSEGGRDAVALAVALADPDAAFLLVDVIPPVGIFTMHPRLLEDEEPPQSRGFFVEALEELAGREVETRTYIANSAAHVMTELAEQEDFDLIAIGHCYPGVVGRILLGSTGQGLTHGAAAPVAAAPRLYADLPHEGIKTIVVAYDGSPEAHAAVTHAEVLARREGARLRLLTVEVEETSFHGVIGWEPTDRQTPDEILSAGVDAVAPDIKVDGRCVDGGSIAGEIADFCAEGVDLVVVGSRGYGTIGRALSGSVGSGLLHHATCPVLIVPRPPLA